MRFDIACDFPADFDAASVLEPLARVIDPELDESIVDLGFVRSVRLHHGHAEVALQLPTNWCAVNFAYLMAEDVRRALLRAEGIRGATIRLGDHCAAREIETAVNEGKPFAEAFSEEGAGNQPRGAPSHFPPQRVFHPPGALAEGDARGGLGTGGAVRTSPWRCLDRG